MVALAGALLTANLVNHYLAPDYEYVVNATATTVGTPTGTFNDYTGQLSVSINVTETGVLLVCWGFEGHNNVSTASSLRVGVALSGANLQAPTTDLTATCSNSGVGNNGNFSASRMHLYTGLSQGATTVTLKGYISSGTTSSNSMDNQFLFVSQYY